MVPGLAQARWLGSPKALGFTLSRVCLWECGGQGRVVTPRCGAGGSSITSASCFGPFSPGSTGACAATHSGAFQDPGCVGLVLSFAHCWILYTSKATYYWSSAIQGQNFAVTSSSFLPIVVVYIS